jgi:hypothetical protein
MKTILSLLMILALLPLSSVTRADDAKKEPAKAPAKEAAGKKNASMKGDPSGTWTWTMSGPNGQSFESSAALKREGDKVTGTITGRRGETPISDGQFKDGTISFSVVRERDGRKMTSKFTGKLEGDSAIKGTMTMDRGEGPQSRPWEAKKK